MTCLAVLIQVIESLKFHLCLKFSLICNIVVQMLFERSSNYFVEGMLKT